MISSKYILTVLQDKNLNNFSNATWYLSLEQTKFSPLMSHMPTSLQFSPWILQIVFTEHSYFQPHFIPAERTWGDTKATRQATGIARNWTSFSHTKPHPYCQPTLPLARWLLFLKGLKKHHWNASKNSNLPWSCTMHICRCLKLTWRILAPATSVGALSLTFFQTRISCLLC